ncbi:hypothetical protein [Vibrio gallaecicus]|nr:hypothetical protein [Vibrio gallaecicus]MDN3613002.1 hypothetical protein [Vibrio gallaecicus]
MAAEVPEMSLYMYIQRAPLANLLIMKQTLDLLRFIKITLCSNL